MPSFKKIYDSIDSTPPKTAWVRRIARATMSSEFTVRMWLSGRQVPGQLTQHVIARELGVPVEGLFPQRPSAEALS